MHVPAPMLEKAAMHVPATMGEKDATHGPPPRLQKVAMHEAAPVLEKHMHGFSPMPKTNATQVPAPRCFKSSDAWVLAEASHRGGACARADA